MKDVKLMLDRSVVCLVLNHLDRTGKTEIAAEVRKSIEFNNNSRLVITSLRKLINELEQLNGVSDE